MEKESKSFNSLAKVKTRWNDDARNFQMHESADDTRYLVFQMHGMNQLQASSPREKDEFPSIDC